MIGALFTALFFGITPVCANQAIRLLGFARANFWRLLIAVLVLGLWTISFGRPLQEYFWWFFGAGAVGFGLGGMCMFLALPRLGAPLASLMVESLAAVCATALAWAWYGDTVPLPRLLWAALIILGVAVGLAPYIMGRKRLATAPIGVFWVVLAGLGQAVSITVSRKALLAMKLAHLPVSLPTAAFHRLLGGVCVALVLGLLLRRFSLPRNKNHEPSPGLSATASSSRPSPSSSPVSGRARGPAWLWVGLNALFGPILGVTCLIWALKTMQPGLAQTIAATAPLVSVPFARWLDGHTPPPLYYLGCVMALAGLAGIYLSG